MQTPSRILRTSTPECQEYKGEHPDGYQHSQFCEHYRRWAEKIDVSMRQVHRVGEKLFVDFSGDGIPFIAPHSGERREASLFIAALDASSRFYAEATESERLRTGSPRTSMPSSTPPA